MPNLMNQSATDYLNLGCGHHYHPEWTNIDFVSTGKNVISHNLRKGIPFPEASFDIVYHSHLLEHLHQVEARDFLRQCFRVLRPQGILRVVVPDLEQIVRLYLTALEKGQQGVQKWDNHYRWILLELYDQTVREFSGGQMAAYLAQDPIPNEDFVIQRIGREAENLITFLRQLRSQPQPPPPKPSERELLLQELLGDEDYQALQIGRFRRSGEVHQWMYDRYSLKVLLESVGFEHICICQATESQIPEFEKYGLDVEADGRVRKPDSLFMEATKPQTIGTAAVCAAQENQPIVIANPPKTLQDLSQVIYLNQTIQELQTDLQQTKSKLQKTQTQLKKIQTKFQDAKTELERFQSNIQWMETSKFWKLRSLVLRFKQIFSNRVNNHR